MLTIRTKQVSKIMTMIGKDSFLCVLSKRAWTEAIGCANKEAQMDGAVVDIRMKNDEKNKALEAAIGQIEKAFGKGSVMKLGQESQQWTYKPFPLDL